MAEAVEQAVQNAFNKVAEAFATVSQTLINFLTEQGDVFNVSHIQTGISDEETAEWVIEVGENDSAQIRLSVVGQGKTTVELYENGDYSGGGSNVLVENLKRSSSKTPSSSWSDSPTVNSDGTKIAEDVSGTDGLPSGNGRVSGVSKETKFILEAGQSYLIRATNQSSSSSDLGLSAEFYEEAP